MPNKPTVIIAAISSRPYVKAAVNAGFDVIAIDAFVDMDTQAMCQAAYHVACPDNQFDRAALLHVLSQIELSHVMGFCYGAGFEQNPEILSDINDIVMVIGNDVDAIKCCKSPRQFFDFCAQQNMAYPCYQYRRPDHGQGWLEKQIGGSGGQHIRLLDAVQHDDAHVYYQQIQAGHSLSCLFVADQHGVQLVGMNEQWQTADQIRPYRYGGAASQVAFSDDLKQQLLHFLDAAKQTFNLRGLNSCDFILHHDVIYMLEINPRLSASLDLYHAQHGQLFSAHIDACLGKAVAVNHLNQPARAHQIVYATTDVVIDKRQQWPVWVADIPSPQQQIMAGMPICTVIAEAENTHQAKQLVQQRANLI